MVTAETGLRAETAVPAPADLPVVPAGRAETDLPEAALAVETIAGPIAAAWKKDGSLSRRRSS